MVYVVLIYFPSYVYNTFYIILIVYFISVKYIYKTK